MNHSLIIGAAIMAATSANAATPGQPQTIIITSSECLVTAKAKESKETQRIVGPIVAILAPVLVELAIDSVSAELRKVRIVKSSGSLDLNLWKRPKEGTGLVLNLPRCVSVLTGEFKDGTISKDIEEIKTSTTVGAGASMATVIRRLADNDVLADKIYHVFEAQAKASGDGTAFSYEPVYFQSEEMMPGNSARKQGLVYNIALRGPGAAPWGTTYALAPISIGEVEAGMQLSSSDDKQAEKLRKSKAAGLSMPGMSDSAFMAYVRDWEVRKITEFMPANLQVEVVQTKKPADAAVFFATVLEKAKPKLVEKAGTLVDPEGPFKARQAKLEAEIASREADKVLADLKATAPDDKAAIKIAELKATKAKEKYESLK